MLATLPVVDELVASPRTRTPAIEDLSTRPVPSSGGALRRLDIVVLLVITVLGAMHLAYPFIGDQALFTIGARQITHGAVLYRDFWDIKQPGIFVFYLAGGTLAGFNEVAIHTLELATLLAFSVVLQRTSRRFVRTPWVCSVLPLLIVGLYYSTARPFELAQIEALIGLPLYLSVWFAMRSLDNVRGRQAWLIGSGLAASVAGLLKLVCLPLAVPAWLVVVVIAGRRHPRGRVRSGLTTAGWIGLGVVVPLGIAVAYFAANGLLHEVSWTYFTYTPATIGMAGRPLSRLIDSVTRFMVLGAPVMVLAAFGFGRTLRRGWDRWSISFAGWLAIGAVVFLTQHWWAYQLSMFFVPLGFFAARGIEVIAATWRTWPRRVPALVAIFAVIATAPLAAVLGKKVVVGARHGFGVTSAGRSALQDAEEPQYRIAREFAAFVRAHAGPKGDVYVLGNPIDLLLTGRDQPIPTNGWEAEQYTPAAWERIAAQLSAAKPRVLVVDDFSAGYMRRRSPATARIVDGSYCLVRRVDTENWYLLRTRGCPAPPALAR